MLSIDPSMNLFYWINSYISSSETHTNIICPNDLTAYQVTVQITQIGDYPLAGLPNSPKFCWVIQLLGNPHNGTSELYRCNGVADCHNTIESVPVDEHGCKRNTPKKCLGVRKDLIGEYVSQASVCDEKCDCASCSDEAHCYGQTFGMFCKSPDGAMVYIQPRYVCDGVKHCFDGRDEVLCRAGEVAVCKSMNFITMKDSRILTKENMCGPVGKYQVSILVCTDFRDQMNCSVPGVEPGTPASSPLVCNVNGYPTTISKRMVCGSVTRNKQLCDDGIDKMCRTPGWQCTLHKHQLCDGKLDCEGREDEIGNTCLYMIEDFTCTRKFMTGKKIPIKMPGEWVGDSIEDCENGDDEKDRKWYTKCGLGTLQLKSLSPSSCQGMVMLKCPGHPTALLRSDAACTNRNYCDNSLCIISRRNDKLGAEVWTTELGYKKNLGYCLPGLLSLFRHIEPCIVKEFYIGPKALYTTNTQLTLPINSQQPCEDIFGELYVYLSCTGSCAVSCPLKPLLEESCASSHSERFLTINTDHQLTRVVQGPNGTFTNNLFGCSNLRCVPYSQVCDLVDDCGDQSDEIRCENNFRCTTTKEFIAKSRRCDGVFDCQDFSDECNDDCTTTVKILPNVFLKVSAWVLGLVAVVLNIAVLVQGLQKFFKLETNRGRTNKAFVLVISFGDFLQGLFLLCVAVGDTFFNKSTCESQFEWLTKPLCPLLGIFSTIGSLISLHSMSLLSLIRMKGILSAEISGRTDLNRRYLVKLAFATLAILVLASFIAAVPVIPQLEDFFVRSVVYENNKYFVGSINKEASYKILQGYYGRFRSAAEGEEMKWEKLRYLVQDMYNDTSPTVKSLSFYATSGICLFNYFENIIVRVCSVPLILVKCCDVTVAMATMTCVTMVTMTCNHAPIYSLSLTHAHTHSLSLSLSLSLSFYRLYTSPKIPPYCTTNISHNSNNSLSYLKVWVPDTPGLGYITEIFGVSEAQLGPQRFRYS
eukprot:sb/3461643/